MSNLKWEDASNRGLRYYGEMTASISHEIKNCLAIINENAGLLQDLVALGQRATPLDPARMDRIAGQIANQIRRADDIVKKLNQFAHSVDTAEKQVDVVEILSLAVAIGHRIANNRGIKISIDTPASGDVLITTQVFCLLHVLWRCLEVAMQAAGAAKAIHMSVVLSGETAEVHFKNLQEIQSLGDDALLPKCGIDLLAQIDARLLPNVMNGEMILVLPKTLDSKA